MDTSINFNDLSDMENGWLFLIFLKKHNITFEIIQWEGPGGGLPLIGYKGTEQALRHLLKERFNCQDSDVEFHMSESVEV